MIELDGDLVLEIHLMSAGRLQLFDSRASLRDRTSRLLVRLADGRELRLREFGTRQRAWVKLLRAGEVESARRRSRSSAPRRGPIRRRSPSLLDQPRPLYALMRDQHVIAGIGRSWVDEILHAAMISPFKRGSDLAEDEAERLRDTTVEVLGDAITHYEADALASDPRQAADAAHGPPPQRRAVPALRRPARGGLLRGLRDVLLPDLPNGGQAPQGPPALPPAQVARLTRPAQVAQLTRSG